MTDKELKKLSKAEILEMLLDEGREIESLQEEKARLQEELDAANIRLAEYSSLLGIIDRLGSYVDRLEGKAPEQTEAERETGEPEAAEAEENPEGIRLEELIAEETPGDVSVLDYDAEEAEKDREEPETEPGEPEETAEEATVEDPPAEEPAQEEPAQEEPAQEAKPVIKERSGFLRKRKNKRGKK